MATAVELLREIRKTSRPKIHVHEFLGVFGVEECVSCRRTRAVIEEHDRFTEQLFGRPDQ